MIAGDGSMAEHCRWLASKGSNPRIVFHQPWKLSETTKVLQAADLLILPTQGEQSMVSVPSKLISYMFSARPVLALAQQDSEIANTILDSDSGWVVQPGNQQELSRQILEISTFNKSELGRRGEAGGNFARRYYSKSANLPKVIDVLESAARKVRHDPIHATC
jgi:glycosyltransferase involved in cell wall biosynthesis